MGFAPIDYGILFFYLIGVTVFGAWLGKKQKDTKDYFVGGRELQWTAVCFSVVVSETRTLTFISILGSTNLSNLHFLQPNSGYFICYWVFVIITSDISKVTQVM